MNEYYGNRGGFGGFLSSLPPVTKNIILINMLVYIAMMFNENLFIENFALFYPTSHFFRPWQIVTHMFLHGGFWHLFFNMYSLLIFGIVMERTIGSKKFFLYYMLTGLGAMALHLGVQYLQVISLASAVKAGSHAALASYSALMGTPTIGASGAIYGVLLGYAMLYPDSVLTLIFPPVSLKAKWFVVIFAVIELLTGIFMTSDGIAHFAHLGGMIFGFVIMFVWKRQRRLYSQDKWW